MGSSRLPGKVLLPLGNSCELDYVVTRCREVKEVADVIVATSTLGQDDPIAEWCGLHGVSFFRGSEEDVLKRYVDAAAPHDPDYVVRVTADCPFVDYQLADKCMEALKRKPADLVVLRGELPRGLAVEFISYSALQRIDAYGHEPRHREHVTYYAYEFPNQFLRTYVDVPAALQYPQLRITLDTEEDYALCCAVADAFQGRKTVPSAEVVRFLNRNPEVAALNAHIEQKLVV